MLEDKRLDKDVPIPLYFQLEKLILEEIDNGNYPVGSMIPTEMELSQMFGISRTTVRQAISDLVREEHLYRIKSKGTFVAHPSWYRASFRASSPLTTTYAAPAVPPAPRYWISSWWSWSPRWRSLWSCRGHQGHLSLPQAVCRRRAHRPGGDLPAL